MTVTCGDCRDVMAAMDDASVDAIVTDPPYGLAFLGHAWDRRVPDGSYWEPALRIAKPGAYLLAFGGARTSHRLTCAIEDAGWTIKDSLIWLHGQGFPKSPTSLKPAWEPIILAQKRGTGRLNIDDCRIEIGAVPPSERRHTSGGNRPNYGGGFTGRTGLNDPRHPESQRLHAHGRWPANVMLDETAATMLDAQSGHLRAGAFPARRNVSGYGGGLDQGDTPAGATRMDAGGAARFFYCAKASPRERGPDNDHPTVKPVSLMRWLVRLVTPPGGLVFDPFAGSGSTGIACAREHIRFAGAERDPAYVEIARRRIAREVGPLFAGQEMYAGERHH